MRIASRAAIVTALLAVALAWAPQGFVVAAGAASAKADGDNPAPVIVSLTPKGVAAGGPGITLTLEGSGFGPASQVRWNGQARPTSYVTAERLSAQIAAADVATTQTAFVTVSNPEPGGGLSPPASFLVVEPNPRPLVTGVSPAQALAGGGPVAVTVIGSDFLPSSTVLWNGEARETVFINDRLLTATVRAADMTAAGTAAVSVSTPAPGGGESPSALVFTVLSPAPTLALLQPGFVWAGGPGFTLTVVGSGFTRASVIQWAGADRLTRFISSEHLQADIAAPEVAEPGLTTVRVFTPPPGGGLSLPLSADVHHDDVPPVTTVKGLTGLWHNTAAKFTLVASDEGLGVLWTGYRIGQIGQFATGTIVTVPAPKNHSNDGMHVVQYRSADKAFNWEEPAKEVRVGIDTWSPTTAVVGAAVKRNGALTPRFRIDDPISQHAGDATLVISSATNKVLLRCDLGQPPTRKWCTGAACQVPLPRGTYRMRVLAHDLAGNRQSATKSAALKVY
jgi:hypothetical protein